MDTIHGKGRQMSESYGSLSCYFMGGDNSQHSMANLICFGIDNVQHIEEPPLHARQPLEASSYEGALTLPHASYSPNYVTISMDLCIFMAPLQFLLGASGIFPLQSLGDKERIGVYWQRIGSSLSLVGSTLRRGFMETKI